MVLLYCIFYNHVLSQFAGETPLHIAVKNNHERLAELLLANEAAVTINVKDRVSACIITL